MTSEPEYCDICEREVSTLQATLGGGMCHDCAVMYEQADLLLADSAAN